jgi:hypothetical protein
MFSDAVYYFINNLICTFLFSAVSWTEEDLQANKAIRDSM